MGLLFFAAFLVPALLVDFFNPQAIAGQVVQALESPGDFTAMRQQARQTIIDRYDLKRICLPQHLAVINEMAAK